MHGAFQAKPPALGSALSIHCLPCDTQAQKLYLLFPFKSCCLGRGWSISGSLAELALHPIHVANKEGVWSLDGKSPCRNPTRATVWASTACSHYQPPPPQSCYLRITSSTFLQISKTLRGLWITLSTAGHSSSSQRCLRKKHELVSTYWQAPALLIPWVFAVLDRTDKPECIFSPKKICW